MGWVASLAAPSQCSCLYLGLRIGRLRPALRPLAGAVKAVGEAERVAFYSSTELASATPTAFLAGKTFQGLIIKSEGSRS